MILHTLSAGPGSKAFHDCLRIATEKDAILLSGDGVYGALEKTAVCSALLNSGAELHVLEPDARAAGVAERLSKRAKLESFNGFVTLSERFPRQLAWY